MSGFSPKSSEQAKVFVAKDIPFTYSPYKIYKFISSIKLCSQAIIDYLYRADVRMNVDFLDLSMFSQTDLYLFNPQFLGENKEFIFKNWDTYIEYTKNNPDDSLAGGNNYLLLDLEACKKFEEKNKMLLSEVGHRVVKELVWNSKFKNLLDDDLYIN